MLRIVLVCLMGKLSESKQTYSTKAISFHFTQFLNSQQDLLAIVLCLLFFMSQPGGESLLEATKQVYFVMSRLIKFMLEKIMMILAYALRFSHE